MAKQIDYSVEQSKQLGAINAILAHAKNMKIKRSLDGECRTLTVLCAEVGKRQDVLDKFIADDNAKMRKFIISYCDRLGMDELEVDKMFYNKFKVKLFKGNSQQLHQFYNHLVQKPEQQNNDT